jgi:glycerate kinase
MHILVVPQEFKGSMTAAVAARAIAAGAHDAAPQARLTLAPVSDGGPGFVDAMLTAIPGKRIETEVRDPLGRPVRAAWALLEGGVAVIEMAAASGLLLVRPDERTALDASTRGTGELIVAALGHGATEVIVGAGGSATTDGGAGALQALGARLLDAGARDLPPGGAALTSLDRMDASGVDARLAGVRLRVATDVTNVLCGRAGAAAMFGPQKGASPADVQALDAALAHFAAVVRRDTGIDVASLRGGGAAGGLAAGLAAVGARIEAGFDIVAAAIGLDDLVRAADVVITGEGRLDAQTPYGKAPARVAAMARTHGKRVVALAGMVDPSFDATMFDRTRAISLEGMSVEEAMRRGPELLRAASARIVRELLAAG